MGNYARDRNGLARWLTSNIQQLLQAEESTMLTTAFPLAAERREFEQIIRENIDAQTGRRLLNIEVKLVGNKVMVKGEALSFYIKQLALVSVLKTVRAWGPLQVMHDIRVKILPKPEVGFYS